MKYIMLTILSLSMVACSKKNEQYYRTNPEALKEAIIQCPAKSPKHVTCEVLRTLAIKMNESADELRTSPQHYGQKILALQEKVAKQSLELLEKPSSTLDVSYHENMELLNGCLAVVKWLESPGS